MCRKARLPGFQASGLRELQEVGGGACIVWGTASDLRVAFSLAFAHRLLHSWQ